LEAATTLGWLNESGKLQFAEVTAKLQRRSELFPGGGFLMEQKIRIIIAPLTRSGTCLG
jgi:hypothetical protein